MRGQMMQMPLTIQSLVDHAALYHGETEIVSVETDGSTQTTTWAGIRDNARRLASALSGLGLGQGDRVATLAWNNRRHLETYFGTSGAGFVLHTLNPRLHPDQLTYIVNHAQDRVLMLDVTFVPLIAAIRDRLETVRHVVVMAPRAALPEDAPADLIAYDDLLDQGDPGFEWADLDETAASSLCYTSGTTGHPKGVLFSHRSTVLHSIMAATPDILGLSATKRVLPVVPMFHVNAWGTPYACALTGAPMVLPGPNLDGASLVRLIDTYKVHQALGVPTVWLGLLDAAAKSGSRLESLEQTVVGGSACPPSMIATFRDRYGVETIHAWGMTEMSPIGTANAPKSSHAARPDAERQKLRENQGRPPWGVSMQIVGEDGAVLPRDGQAQGDLLVRGHWIIDSYMGLSRDETLAPGGWFHTGDVASIDADGYLTIRDRSKDIIKSGGEWISSVELEGIAMAHPGIANAAAIGARHPKWDERPVLIAVPAEGQSPTEAEVQAFLGDKVARWQVPDRVIFVEALPLGATGKVLKRALKEEYGSVLMEG